MPEAVNIKSLDGLRDFRVALIDYIDKAKRATSSAESEINHMHSWLSNTQLMHWKHSIRRAEEKLSQAKSELFRATISQPDNPRGPTDQIKLLRTLLTRALRLLPKRHNQQVLNPQLLEPPTHPGHTPSPP